MFLSFLLLLPTIQTWALDNNKRVVPTDYTDDVAKAYWQSLTPDQRIQFIKEGIALRNDTPVFPVPEYGYVLEKNGDLTVFPIFPSGQTGEEVTIGGTLKYELIFPTFHFKAKVSNISLEEVVIASVVSFILGPGA